MGKPVSVKAVAKALKAHKGFITYAANELGCTRQTVHNMINKHPKLQEVLKDAKENMLDFTESKLGENISQGKTAEILFYLKTQGKERGYIEKADDSGAGTTIIIKGYEKTSPDEL